MQLSLVLAAILALTVTWASPTPVERAVACSSYTLIVTRGTTERQGPSAGFTTMNANIMRALPGGRQYNTVYPAASNQDSSQATRDIINQVSNGVRSNPNACFVLQGYSQGAAGTVNALRSLTGASFNAVRGVFLIGNPLHRAGLACNVDANGGATTRNVNGISARAVGANGIPSTWISKTLDVCIQGDGICSAASGFGITAEHLSYPRSAATQNLGTRFITTVLRGGNYNA